MMSLLPDAGRRHPVHHEPVDKFNRGIIVFLTVCTKDRRPILANATSHDVLTAWWGKSTHWLVGRYAILPDHVHLFCSPGSDEPLQKWVAYWKNMTARELRTGPEPFWQQDFWDTQLRTGDTYGAKWEYVRHNPVRHGLVGAADDWPYQGELNILDWV